VSTEEKTWEKSFQTRPRLSPQEAHRVVVLRQRLTELRYLSSEYLLRRATLSNTKSEKTAWESVWALVVFVEHHRRFPRQGELYPYLHEVLDESRPLESLKLPEIDIESVQVSLEAQKSLLETLQHDKAVLADRLHRVDEALAKLLRIGAQLEPGEPASKLDLRGAVVLSYTEMQRLKTLTET